MKIGIAQLNFHIGNIDHNKHIILRAINEAKGKKADLLVFPELAVCGYPPQDLLNFDSFIEQCQTAMEEIARATNGIAVIIGGPEVNTERGKDLHNSAFFLSQGQIQKVVHKALLPTYDVFDERRYFEPPRTFESIHYLGRTFALTICEDLWTNTDLYFTCPMDELNKQKPDAIISLAASPFSYQHEANRRVVLQGNSRGYGLPVIYVNHVGAQTELIFDGNSLFMNAEGQEVAKCKAFAEDLIVVDLDRRQPESPIPAPASKIEKIHDALILGIRDYFFKQGFKKALLGLSGGIDSAIVAVLAERALGKENVLAVLLPSEFSTSHSVSDALALVETLGINHEKIEIKELYDVSIHKLAPIFQGLPFDVTEENLQARIRGLLLMAISNKQGSILLNTSNKSELAVGYGTLYGDLAGGISVLGDVYKTEVYELAGFINRDHEIIPRNIISKPPSAELRPGQKDSDSLPEYAVLDQVLRRYIEAEEGKSIILEAGFDPPLVDKILALVNRNEYKRYQAPPVLRVSPKAFGPGRRMPIVAKYDI